MLELRLVGLGLKSKINSLMVEPIWESSHHPASPNSCDQDLPAKLISSSTSFTKFLLLYTVMLHVELETLLRVFIISSSSYRPVIKDQDAILHSKSATHLPHCSGWGSSHSFLLYFWMMGKYCYSLLQSISRFLSLLSMSEMAVLALYYQLGFRKMERVCVSAAQDSSP